MIHLQYDCPEDIVNLPKNDCGFYCEACKKNVFDFRGKSLVEIAKLKSDNPTVSCGVFDAEVVKEDNRTAVQNIFRIAFAAIFVMGFNASILFSQSVNDVDANVQLLEEVKSENAYLTGTVYNQRGKAVSATLSYYINDERIEVKTDENGKFKIELPSEVLGKAFGIDVSAEGMYAKYLSIPLIESKCYTYEINLDKIKRRPRHPRHHGGKFKF